MLELRGMSHFWTNPTWVMQDIKPRRQVKLALQLPGELLEAFTVRSLSPLPNFFHAHFFIRTNFNKI